jgi:hypothetical protein
MANTLTEVKDKLLAQGLMALRRTSLTPRLVNRDIEEQAAGKGDTVNVPIPSAQTVADVTPAATPPSTQDVAPTSVPIVMDRWKESAFYLTDKEQLEVMEGTIPMQASEALEALVSEVDRYVLSLASKAYGYHGTAGTTPFTAGGVDRPTDVTKIRAVLNKQLAPLNNRHIILDPDAEAAALNLRAFHDMSFSGDVSAILAGMLNQKFGFQWWMSQNVRTHTAGTMTTALVNNGAGYAAGTKTIAIDGDVGTMLVGDVISFAGHSQTYVVTEGQTGAGSISFEPGLLVAVADNVAITIRATHVMNLAMHRDFIAFASRPLAGSNHPSSVISQVVDPISGLALRLEITREHRRDRFAYDILYGADVVRRELGARLAG